MDLVHASYGPAFTGGVPSRIFLNDGAGFFEEFNPSGYQLTSQNIANGVPDELIDASRLDGTGLFGTYWRIVLPLSVPGLVVVGIMQFVAIWNDFLYSLLVLKSEDMRTATLAIAVLSQRSQAATLYGPLFAGIVVVTLPPIILYFIFQRRLTSGLLAGSMRG